MRQRLLISLSLHGRRRTEDFARNSDRGTILIGVIFALLLLALFTLPIMTIGREVSLTTKVEVARTRAQMRAEAGIALAIAEILNGAKTSQRSIDGTPMPDKVPGGDATIMVWSDAGRIDINSASSELLSALFQTTGMPGADAEKLAGEALDWRTPSTPSTSGNTTSGTNTDDGRTIFRHGRFEAADELLWIPGMTPSLFQRIRPAVTVFSSQPLPTRAVASTLVRAALDRLSGSSSTPTGGDQPSSRLAGLGALNGQAFTIQADVEISGAAHVIQEASIRVTGDAHNPFWVLAWRELPIDQIRPELQ
jgi:general secretion pathway protein K